MFSTQAFGVIAFFGARHFILTLLLPTQVYTGEFNTYGIALRWTNVPSWTVKNFPGCFMLQETRIQPYVMVQIFTMEKNNVDESNEMSNLPRIKSDIIFQTK